MGAGKKKSSRAAKAEVKVRDVGLIYHESYSYLHDCHKMNGGGLSAAAAARPCSCRRSIAGFASLIPCCCYILMRCRMKLLLEVLQKSRPSRLAWWVLASFPAAALMLLLMGVPACSLELCGLEKRRHQAALATARTRRRSRTI
jgi:energy-converting hydrogenase Eha subunit A